MKIEEGSLKICLDKWQGGSEGVPGKGSGRDTQLM